MKKKALLKGAIYYNSNNWTHLISQGIAPFLKENLHLFGHFYIFLSNYRGDHIKLIFELNESFKSVAQKKFEAYFIEFVRSNSSSKPENTFIPGKVLWMNFENNSVEIDNFETHFLISEPLFLRLNQTVSYLIIYLFPENEIETFEDIIQLAIYLLVRVLGHLEPETILSNLEDAMTTIIQTSNLSIRNDEVNEVVKDSKNTALENVETLSLYLSEDSVERSEPHEIYEIVILEWISECRQIIYKANGEISNLNIQKIISVLNIQLGFDEMTKIYILNLLKWHFKSSAGATVSN
jgi:hypothetical protein